MISWGLPVSLLTFAGNLLFSPILTLFLLLSSLIFFCQLISIPCGPFEYLLDIVTRSWLWSMHIIPGHWFIGFPTIHPLVLLILVIAVLAVVHARFITKPLHGVALLLMIALSFYGIAAWWATPKTINTQVPMARGTVMIVKNMQEIIVIDDGTFARQVSLLSWLEYTLLPEIIRKTGATHIDHLVVASWNTRTLLALVDSIAKLRIKKIYLPSWTGYLPPKLYRAMQVLKKAAHENNCSLIFIFDKTWTINKTYQIIPDDYRQKEGYMLRKFQVNNIITDEL